MIKQPAFLPSTPAKGAPLHCGHRRRRSGLPGECIPAAASNWRTKAASQISQAEPPATDLARLLELFDFYDGRVPGFELNAEGFDVHLLEAEGFIFCRRNPSDFGCYLIGRALKKYATAAQSSPTRISNVNTFNINLREKT